MSNRLHLPEWVHLNIFLTPLFDAVACSTNIKVLLKQELTAIAVHVSIAQFLVTKRTKEIVAEGINCMFLWVM